MALVTTVQPAQEPVSSTDLASFLRIDPSDTDSVNNAVSLALGARVLIEGYLRRRLITQTLQYSLDHFPWGDVNSASMVAGYPMITAGASLYDVNSTLSIWLPGGNVQSISSFTFLTAGVSATPVSLVPGPGNDYIQDVASVPARLTPPWGKPWPPMGSYNTNSVQITYVVGYGDTGADVPGNILSAIKMLTAMYYENRLPLDADIPMQVKALLHRDKIIY